MLTKELEETLSLAVDEAFKRRHEFVTLEHLLYALLDDKTARDILYNCGADLAQIGNLLENYFDEVMEKLPEGATQMPELTSTFQSIIQYAMLQAEGSGQQRVDGGNILAALFQAEQSYAVYALAQQNVKRLDVCCSLLRTAFPKMTIMIRCSKVLTKKNLPKNGRRETRNRSNLYR